MYEFSVPMALTDFIPVALFAVAAVLMQRDYYAKMPKYAFACLAAGCVNKLPTTEQLYTIVEDTAKTF